MSQKTYHLIGIGGIGMSALARLLLQNGERVQGSDAAASPLLEQLQKEGVTVFIGHQAEWVHADCIIVYSSAVKPTNVEWQKAKALDLPCLHRSELLAQLMAPFKRFLVTGTHGKTTTSSLLAAVLMEAGEDPSFALGGILRSLQTNARMGQGPYFVAEADESDGSFLKSTATGAIVTNLENDHLDYWKKAEKLDEAFSQFFAQVEDLSLLFWWKEDKRLQSLTPKGTSYGFSSDADLQITQYRALKEGIVFDLNWEGEVYAAIELSLAGRHNALNAAAVFGLALRLGVSESALRSAFRSFKGASRRLEKKGEGKGVCVYDDYGHHPTEIAATLGAVKERLQQQRLIAVFQPHRYTRVADLMEEFSHCFEAADLVVMTDIYSAGETPIAGVTTEALLQKMRAHLSHKLLFVPRKQLEEAVSTLLQPSDVVVTLGAGDVTRAAALIFERYLQRIDS